MVLRSAVRARIIAVNPAEGVQNPRDRTADVRPGTISRADFLGSLLPAVPKEHRVIVALHEGIEWMAEFTTEREAVERVAVKASGGLRFHDLRHSYATWLVADGVPVNVVQLVMGHEQASTTLNRYTHTPADFAERSLLPLTTRLMPRRSLLLLCCLWIFRMTRGVSRTTAMLAVTWTRTTGRLVT